MNIHETKNKILFTNVDAGGKVTPFALFDFFQDAAEDHAEMLGVGREVLQPLNQVWVLSRMSVLVEKRPKFNDSIKLRTWPRGYDRLFCVRDYDISDESGQTMVRSRSGWLVFDMEKHRPLRPQSLPTPLPANDGLDALSGTPLGLDAQEHLKKIAERKAAYSDIDMNGHVNNARYVQWIQDIADGYKLRDALSLRIDINYQSETHLNDLMEFWCADIPANDNLPDANYNIAIEGRKIESGKTESVVAFRAELRVRCDTKCGS